MVATFGNNLDAALRPIEQAIKKNSTVFLFDNMESVLLDERGSSPAGVADLTELLTLCARLQATDKKCRLVFTSREHLPQPFGRRGNVVELGRLSRQEAILLVERVMVKYGIPPANDDAKTLKDVEVLVETVNCHPRALVLLAQELPNGVRVTSQNISALMAKLEKENPGDKENSLYASLEMSLQRLSSDMREHIKGLAVVHGGTTLLVAMKVMNLEQDAATTVLLRLIEVGMAEEQEYGYISLDPSLPTYLKLNQTTEQLVALENAWIDGMGSVIELLQKQLTRDSRMALKLTSLELPNLSALIPRLSQKLIALNQQIAIYQKTAEINDKATQIKHGRARIRVSIHADTTNIIVQLLYQLNYPQVYAQAVALQEQAAEVAIAIGIRGYHERFEYEGTLVERLLDQGQIQEAFNKAQKLLEDVKSANLFNDYKDAGYDLAASKRLLGKVSKVNGDVESALELLTEAQKLFDESGEGRDSARMVATSLSEQSSCLIDMGRLQEAAEVCKRSIRQSEKLGYIRQATTSKLDIADIQARRGRHNEAISLYEEARIFFVRQKEPASVAAIWHRIGMVQQEISQYDSAEISYRRALEISTNIGDVLKQTATLHQLAMLYDASCLDRLDDALICSRQSVKISMVQGDSRSEGSTRTNCAFILYRLERYDEARHEILSAIKCIQPLDYIAQPWTAFNTLHLIETADDNLTAAHTAQLQARDIYVSYRRQGGYAQQDAGRLSEEVWEWVGLQKGIKGEVIQYLSRVIDDDEILSSYRCFSSKLLAIVNGSRNLDLADDNKLDYEESAEIILLIERFKKIENRISSTDGEDKV